MTGITARLALSNDKFVVDLLSIVGEDSIWIHAVLGERRVPHAATGHALLATQHDTRR